MKESSNVTVSANLRRYEQAIREIALTYPESHEDFPWGHSAMKVRGKAFLFMSTDGGRLSLSVKLPHSADTALGEPYTQPTGYGLGRSGWVSATFETDDRPPMDLIRAWLAESYRAVAPKKLAAVLDGAPAPVAKKAAVATPKKATVKKAAVAKPKKAAVKKAAVAKPKKAVAKKATARKKPA